MRSVGDHGWLNHYIGIPYQFGGRGVGGLDCYGLVRMIYSDQYGEKLPDWTLDQIDLRGRAVTIAEVVTGGDWTGREVPDDGDFVLCYRARAAFHVGLFFGGGVIHCTDGDGVVYEPMDRFKLRYPALEFGSWQP